MKQNVFIFFLRVTPVTFVASESLAVERDGWSRQDSSLLDRTSQKCSAERKGKKRETFAKIT